MHKAWYWVGFATGLLGSVGFLLGQCGDAQLARSRVAESEGALVSCREDSVAEARSHEVELSLCEGDLSRSRELASAYASLLDAGRP